MGREREWGDLLGSAEEGKGGEEREMSEGKGQNPPFFEKGLLPIQGGKV